jgi:aminotransferase
MLSILSEAGFRCFKPAGAYYVMTDIESFGYPDDLSFSKYLVEKIGIAVVPGSSFYYNPEMGARQVRFTFCKKESTLDACEEKLSKLRHA